jgi:hypothetical protein
MMATMKADREERKASQEVTEACPGKAETFLKNREANTERIEAVAEHHEAPDEATYEEMIGAIEDQSGDQHLAIGYRSSLNKWSQDDGV